MKSMPRSDARHRLDETCRWTVASTLPKGLSRERRGQHPRDGRVPSASEPTAEIRMRDLVQPPEVPSSASAGPSPPSPVPVAVASSAAARTRDALARGRRAIAASSDAGPGRRNAGAQVDEGGLGAGAARLSREVASSAAARPPAEDHQPVDAGPDEPGAWSRFDLGRAMQELRSNRPGVVRRALRRLHLRWYHAPAGRMESLLQAAGIPAEIVVLSKQIVDTCQVCRSWAKPTPRAVATSTLPTRFNQLVQCDLLFIKDKIVLHTIDVCSRFTATEIVENKNTDTLLSALQTSWFKLYGPPRALVSDQEGGLTGPEAAAWLEAREVSLITRAKNQHADMVERHHEILRKQIHLLQSHTLNEGLRASFSAILSEATFAKNVLFNVGGASPYEAVYGRTPPLVSVSSHEAPDEVDDRDADRLRHLALQAMIQASAEARARRASTTKTRAPGEALQLEPGDVIEFWRKASTKDVEAWHGPATVVDVTSVRDGLISVRWQSRILSCRVQDVRRALVYHVMLGITITNSPVHVLQQASESHSGVVIRIGWFRHRGSWRAFESNARYAQELVAGLHVAACHLQFHGVVSFRFGSCMSSLPGAESDESLLVWWDKQKMDCWRHAFMAGNQHINFERLCGQPGREVAFLQFFAEDEAAILELRSQVVDIPNVGGIHEPALPRLADVTEEVSVRARQRLAIEDRIVTEEAVQPEVFDIATPEDTNAGSGNSEIDTDQSSWFAGYAEAPPPISSDPVPEATFVMSTQELEDVPEVAIPRKAAYLVPGFRNNLRVDEVIVIYMTDKPYAVIEREHNVLTRAEALANASDCRVSMVKELARWHKHGAWERAPKSSANNLLTSRWVLKWKKIAGQKAIKSRLVVQGFKDNQEVKNFSATTSRWGQRLILICAVQFDWELVSADVSEAFLRGLTFEELHKSGEDKTLRNVQMLIPPGSEELLRTLPGFEDFSAQSECLRMKKPGFGLKDAPRLWGLALRKVLTKIGLTAVQVDTQLFVKHESGRLVLLVSVHVDDLKLTGVPKQVAEAISILESAFDALTIERDNFDHLGLRHKLHEDGSRSVDQNHYVAELKPIPQADLKLKGSTERVSAEVAHQFMSLLGGIAWVVQTRPDAAVFVSALQRRLKEPCVQDIININRVLKYLKLKPLEVTYHKIVGPWKLVAVSDSAFKSEDQDCLAVRSGIIALTGRRGIEQGVNQMQLVEFVSKKQTKVCRSTFAAELHSCLDLLGLANTINSAMTEVLQGPQSASKLADMHESGEGCLKLDAIIDAMSVWQSVTSEEPRCNDQLVLLHLCKLREVVRKFVDRFLWCDTRSMIADGLTKGVVDRQALRILSSKGTWSIEQQLKVFQFQTPTEHQ